jgi:murein DD-endopeptidase MepM/ murein hydrolase activator NlpD
MSKLRLLNILKEEVTEQGYGRYFKDWKTSDGKTVGDTRGFDFTTNKPFDKDYKNPETEVLSSDNEDVEGSSSTSLININKLNTSNYYSGSSKRGKTYGWRGPIWKLCPKKDRYCDWHWHAGRDYANSTGVPIAILKKGVIQDKGPVCFKIKHYDNSITKYCHCDSVYFSNGETVLPGDIVATVGNKGVGTGPHLHWEYYPSTQDCRTETHASVKGSTKSVTVCDKDPSGMEDSYFVFIKNGKENDFESDVLKIRNSTNDNIKIDNNSGSIYNTLPPDVKKAIDKLRTDWGVNITDYHLKKEMDQEGGTTEDAGGVDTEANRKIKNLIKDCKKQFKKVTTDIISGYRGYNDQVKNFGGKVKNDGRTIDDVQSYNTIPGFSQHHTGKAFDIFSTDPSWWDTNSDVKKWVENNANSYGFEITYTTNGTLRKKEPWHLFYTGNDFEEEDDVLDTKTLSDGKTVVFGGTSYANPEWMKSQWVDAGLSSDRAVFLSYTSGELSTVKKNNKIDKIVGFSAGGSDVWDEIITNSSDYKFIGLIDPSTSESQFKKYEKGGLPSVVKSLSNYSNWSEYPDIKKRLKTLEDNGVLTKTNTSHKEIPLEFFKKYKTNLS